MQRRDETAGTRCWRSLVQQSGRVWVCGYCLLGDIFMVEYHTQGSACWNEFKCVCFYELLVQCSGFNSGYRMVLHRNYLLLFLLICMCGGMFVYVYLFICI